MGKRKRRLHSPKYARKYASMRATYNRLRGIVQEATADGVVTKQEAEEIKQAEEELVQAVQETVAEEIKQAEEELVVEEVAVPPAPEEKVKAKSKKKPAKKKASTRKRTTNKKEDNS